MAGLLDILNRNPGLLSALPRNDVLAPALDQTRTLLATPVPVAPSAPVRGRVNPLRVVDNFLFDGNGIGAAVEQERTRLDNEANRPRLLQRQQQLQSAADAMGPAAQIAYATNPAKFGESLAEQYAPQVIGAGGIQSIAGTGAKVAAPQRFEFGDTVQSFDPLTNDVTQLAERGATIAEKNAQDKLEWDRQYGGRQLDIQQQNADTTAANAGTTLGPGEVRFNTSGAPVARVAPTNQAATNPATIELQGRIDSTKRDVLPTTQRMRSLITSGDVITGFGSGPRLEAARALAAAGNEDAKRKVAATQEYQNLSGALRVGIAKSLGANPSNADIILLEKITAGDVGQSNEALLATISQAEGRANSLIEDVQRQLSSTRPQGSSVPPPPPGFVLDR